MKKTGLQILFYAKSVISIRYKIALIGINRIKKELLNYDYLQNWINLCPTFVFLYRQSRIINYFLVW